MHPDDRRSFAAGRIRLHSHDRDHSKVMVLDLRVVNVWEAHADDSPRANLRNARHEIRFQNSIRRVMHAVAWVQNYCSAGIYHSVYVFVLPSRVSFCFCF